MSFSSKFRLAKIVEVAPITTERVLNFDGLKPYIATADVQDGEIVNTTEITFEGKPSRADISAKTNDVIFARMQNTNKVLVVNEKNENCIFSTGFAVCRPTKKISSDYLRFWLMSDAFNELKDSYCTGATQKAISNSGIEKLTIPLPSLDTQEKIVRLLKQAEQMKKLRQQAELRMGQFIPSLFSKMFGNPTLNEKKWGVKQIKEVGIVKTGNTPPTIKREYYGNEIEWIKSDNINTPSHFLTRAEVYLSKEGKRVGRVVPKGSILVTCIAGNSSTIGNVAIADREVAFNQQINSITPYDFMDTYFLYSQLLTMKEKIKGASSGGMKGIVSKGVFEKISVIVPPISLQRKFSTWMQEAQKMQEIQTKSSERIDSLFKSTLAKAFEGNL